MPSLFQKTLFAISVSVAIAAWSPVSRADNSASKDLYANNKDLREAHRLALEISNQDPEVRREVELLGFGATEVYQMVHRPGSLYQPYEPTAAHYQSVLKSYIDSLDGFKIIFLQEEVEAWTQNSGWVGDALRTGDLSLPNAIGALAKQRSLEGWHIAQKALEKPVQDSDRSWAVDRTDIPYPQTKKEREQRWVDWVTMRRQELILAGKTAEEADQLVQEQIEEGIELAETSGPDFWGSSFLDAYTYAIDPHTQYMSPKRDDGFLTGISLSLSGIGAVLKKEGPFVVISDLTQGGPAAKSGQIKPGDRVLGFYDHTRKVKQEIVGWEVDDVVEQVRGEKGTKITLWLETPGTTSDANSAKTEESVFDRVGVKKVELERDIIKLQDQTARAQLTPDGVGIIFVPSFYYSPADESAPPNSPPIMSVSRDINRLITGLKAAGAHTLLLDLRNNGGGSLPEAVRVAGLFLKEEAVVGIRDTEGNVTALNDVVENNEWEGPLVVLINQGSASASEIVASALQDYGRALIVGQTSYGKGSVQSVIEVEGENPGFEELGHMKVTTAQFFRPSGRSTQIKGVIPDVTIPANWPGMDREEDLPSAMPWARILPLGKGLKSLPSASIAAISSAHAARWKQSEAAKWWDDWYEWQDRRRVFYKEGSLPLALEARKTLEANLEAEGKALEDRRIALKIAAPQSSDWRSSDPVLKEAAAIATDWKKLF